MCRYLMILATAIVVWSGAFDSPANAQCIEDQKLISSGPVGNDDFGRVVTISGDIAVVGASGHDCPAGKYCGSAFIYRFNGTSWIEQQQLFASDAAPFPGFGGSVAVSGDTVVVGAPYDSCESGGACGAAYVFRFNGDSWVEQQKLTASDGKEGDIFGGAVSVSGNTILIGANKVNGFSGAAYVFQFDGATWIEQQKLTASDMQGFARFGSSVTVVGAIALIGAYHQFIFTGDNGEGFSGAAYVFRFNGVQWVEEQELTAFEAANFRGGRDQFGWSVSLSEDKAMVGTHPHTCLSGYACGSVYVFRYDGTSWVDDQKLSVSDAEAIGRFASSVSMDGDKAIIGATDDHCVSGYSCGAAFVFRFDGTSWVEQLKFTASDARQGDSFGQSVAIHKGNAIVGAIRNYCEEGTRCGSAYVFNLKSSGNSHVPEVDAGDNLNLVEGDFLNRQLASFENESENTYAATINWGDGHVTNGIVDQEEGAIIGRHVYGDDGDYKVTYRLSNCNNFDSENIESGSSVMTVTNSNPIVSAGANRAVLADKTVMLQSIDFDIMINQEGQQVPFSVKARPNQATFADLGFDVSAARSYETFTAEVDWGDGSGVQQAMVSEDYRGGRERLSTGTIAASHIYTTPGDYKMCVKISDDDGGSSTDCAMITVAPTPCPFRQKLLPSDAEASDLFGISISVNGDIAVIGATGKDCSAGLHCGAAYVYRFDGKSWIEQQELTITDATPFMSYGSSVSVHGDTIIVGARNGGCSEGDRCGSAYVFRFNGISWVEQQKLTASDAGFFDEFGTAVSVNGNTVMVGARGNGCDIGIPCGAVYVFRFNGISWVELQKLTASRSTFVSSFGTSISLDGDTAVIGSPGDNCQAGINCGAAYVYRLGRNSWYEQQRLTASDVKQDDTFGFSVSVSRDTILVGAKWQSCAKGDRCGAAYTYRFNGTTWIEENKLVASDSDRSRRFGRDVSVSGDTAMVLGGGAYVFRFNGTSWIEEQKLFTALEPTNELHADAVSIDGDTVLAGSRYNDCAAGRACGAAYAFNLKPMISCTDCDGDGMPDEVNIDCNGNEQADACDISNGESEDCNNNRIPDECDIAQHDSDDCNDNNVPDECEPDIDGDGFVDDCDKCPDSDTSKTVVVNACDSMVPNDFLGYGCNMMDKLRRCREEAMRHGSYENCVAKKVRRWRKHEKLTKKETRRIKRCVKQDNEENHHRDKHR